MGAPLGALVEHPMPADHAFQLIKTEGGATLPVRLRAAMAQDYRQRGNNKAIDIQPLRTPGAWATYITKEIGVTTHRLKGRSPYYASRSARTAGRELYEGIRQWLSTGR